MKKQIIKCVDCWAHYELGKLHVCDGLMKELVTAHKQKEADKVLKRQEITKAIGTIGYKIISFIEKEVGIEMVVADLYMVDIGTYTDDEKQIDKILKKTFKHYGIKHKNPANEGFSISYLKDMPLALIALWIMETGNYFKE